MTTRFSFFGLPTRIEFGRGVSSGVGKEAKGLGGTRSAVVTDPGVETAGLVEPAVSHLAEAGLATVVSHDVVPNPRYTQVHHGADLAMSEGCDVLVAVDVGSPMDIAKAIGVVATRSGRAQDYEGCGKVLRSTTPLIAVPTTSGTGSEVTFWAVMTDTARSCTIARYPTAVPSTRVGAQSAPVCRSGGWPTRPFAVR